jgi:hypothetical protein
MPELGTGAGRVRSIRQDGARRLIETRCAACGAVVCTRALDPQRDDEAAARVYGRVDAQRWLAHRCGGPDA